MSHCCEVCGLDKKHLLNNHIHIHKNITINKFTYGCICTVCRDILTKDKKEEKIGNK